MLPTLLRGLLPFGAVVTAIALYQWPEYGSWFAIAFLVSAFCGTAARNLAGVLPRLGVLASMGWYAMPFCLLVISSLGVIWLTLNASRFFDPSNSAEETKVLSATLVGAATAFFGVLWTKDIAETKGLFWPSELIRAAWSDTYDGHAALNAPRSDPAEKAFAALYLDSFEGGSGWYPLAMWHRAGIIAAWAATLRRG